MGKDYEMVDGEKIFKALKLGKVTGLGCTLTSAECDYLIAHDDVLTQYITLLENDQLMNQRIAELEEANKYWSKRALIGECWIPVSEKLPEESDWYLPYYVGYRVTSPIYYDVKLGWYAEDKPDYWMPLPESPIVYGKVCEE